MGGSAMQLRHVAYALVALGATLVMSYGVHQMSKRESADASSPNVLSIEMPLASNEVLWGTAAGDLTGGPQPEIVIGTLLPLDRGRVYVLHPQDGKYRPAWTFTHEAAAFDSAIIRDVNADRRNELITLWLSGQGGYLDVRIFRWDGTYRLLWQLPQDQAQLTQGAQLSIRRINIVGGVELVVRAPNVKPGESTLGALPHQVSVYRWDPSKRTFVLFRRFIDPRKSFE